ncbi:MAG: hypothetical protein P9X24_09190 [Candidatus Hatepunaea meridiana]|nr:hypothetical protein [Candidatus Hatepunaea meridiana]
MSWTDSTTIKKHLFDLDRLPTEYKDVSVELSASSKGTLPHKGLVSSSEVVKRLLTMTPTEQSGVTLNGETWVALSYDKLVPDNIVVAADKGLETVYQLDKDFAFNSVEGKVRRINGGSIGDGAALEVYYLRYQVFTKNIDYMIDYDNGEISVVAGGSLEPETTVLIDYQITADSGADQLIAEAITEAEDKILSILKDEYNASSTDQGLKTGATELATSIICRGLATRSLSDGCTSAEGRARGWRDLSSQFEISAWRTLRPFLHSPQITHGQKKGNQSWEWS